MSYQELPRTEIILYEGIDRGLHIGAQLFAAHKGSIVADLAIGEAEPGVELSPEHLMPWMSSGKPVTSVAIAQLWEAGKLHLDDPVAQYIPEFAQYGKSAITIRHLLTHMDGMAVAETNWPVYAWNDIIKFLCAASMKSDSPPGARAAYHPMSTWYILAEIIQRIVGRKFDEHVRAAILEPLGMNDSWFLIPEDRRPEYGKRLVLLHGLEKTPTEPNRAPWARCKPGGSGRGPIRELGRFYQMLLNRGEWNGVRILQETTVEAITARHRTGRFDHTFQHVVDWGLGFIVDSNLYDAATVPYGFGLHSSPRTFGHGGFLSSIAFADPIHDLVVAWVCNGAPKDKLHQERNRAINAALYEDLGLAS